VTGQQTARWHVLRVEQLLPCPPGRVWRALTDPDLIARWLMPNDFKLEAGHRFAISNDPIRRCGLGGTGHCEVLAFEEGKMLRVAWVAAESMRGLDSAVTFTVAPEGAGTRLLIEHDGLHPCPYTITSIGCGPGGSRSSTSSSPPFRPELLVSIPVRTSRCATLDKWCRETWNASAISRTLARRPGATARYISTLSA
jgi:uncharacterized protein YndB with AHSA1/START domain